MNERFFKRHKHIRNLMGQTGDAVSKSAREETGEAKRTAATAEKAIGVARRKGYLTHTTICFQSKGSGRSSTKNAASVLFLGAELS
jgi:hypothetical protein